MRVLERGLSLWKQAYVLDVSKHDPRGIKWEYRYIFCGFQKENGAAETQCGAESIVLNLLNLKLSYKSWQDSCDTLCDTSSKSRILGFLPVKSIPSTHRNLTTSKKGAKGSGVVDCCVSYLCD